MEDNEVSKTSSPENHPVVSHFISGNTPPEGEGMLRALVDATGESLMLIDKEGMILLANEASAERFHSTVQDLVGTPLYNYLPPDVARSRKELLGAVALSATTVQFVDAGEGRFYDTHAYPVYDENGKVSKIAILACDITERKKSEDSLRESERRFREFVDELPQTVSEFDIRGKHTFVNRKGLETFGSSPEDLARGVHVLDVIAPEDSGRAAKNLQRRLEGEAFGSCEYTMVRRDGSRFPALIHTVPVLSDSRLVGFRSIVVDITEQRRAEEALKQSEERYRGIFENAVLGIFQSSPAGRLLKVNNAFASMHGYSAPDEMIAVTTDIATQHYVNPEDRLRFRELLEEHGVVRHFEAAFYRKDGSTARLLMNARAVKDPGGKMLYYEGTVEDVTEHRRALDAQKEGEERYRTVTENSNDGIAILRGDEYIYVNGRFIELFGYDHPDDFIGKPISTAIHPDDLAMVSENNRRRQRGERIQPRYELKGIKKDGTSLYLDVSVARTTYSGQPVSLIYLRDITERKSLEDQLRQSQKMEAIGQLAGGIAHDFNNILTALIGYGSLLQMNMDEKDRLRVYVNQILTSSQKAANLTQGLLAFSRKQAIALKPCSVNAIITNVENLLRRLLTEDIDLRMNLADKALTVMADSTQIEQVLLNLATNARDSMPSGGTLSIGTAEVEPGREPATITESGETGPYALISVTDTGTGMDDRTREKIFEPFFTTKEAGRGTGLGLSIASGIVKQHNGYITVASEPGSGTSFSIFLPIAKNILELPPRRLTDIRGGKETILVAEDNTEARNLTREILTRSGYTVIEAVDGEDAVRRFMENRNRISLIILDVVMPRKNGKEVYETIKEMNPGIRTIFISGYTADVVIEKGIHDRSVEFISKPLPIEELLSRVRAVLDS